MPKATRALIATAVLSFAPGAASAETLVWGQLDLRAGVGQVSTISGDNDAGRASDPDTIEVTGRLGADWGAFGLQLDLMNGSQSFDESTSAAHRYGQFASLRANYDFGGFVLGTVYGEGVASANTSVEATFDFYALEGAYRLGDSMIGLQIGAFDAQDLATTDAFHDGTFARLSGLYALADGSVISGDLGLFAGSQDTNAVYDMDAQTLGVTYSRQIGARPLAWSLGVEYGRYEIFGAEAGAFSDTRMMLGLTTWFGDNDLASAKRRGFLGQPDFGRITSGGTLLD